jgi:RNA polymerase primary sigma factor
MVPPLISKPDAAISRNLGEQTRMVLAILMPREAQVLRMRFGIGDASVHTAEEIGRSFALSREQILQIESRALRKLRSPGLAARLRGSTRP